MIPWRPSAPHSSVQGLIRLGGRADAREVPAPRLLLERRSGARTEGLRGISEWIGQARSAVSDPRGVPGGTPQRGRKAEAPEIAGRPLGALLIGALALFGLWFLGCAAAGPGAQAGVGTEGAPPDPEAIPFGPDERVAELALMRDVMRDSYAHLEAKRATWGLDLDALFEELAPAARAATTWDAYELAMVRFVNAFRDGHVRWQRRRAPSERRRRIVRLGLRTAFVAEGLAVTELWPGSHAEASGLRVGDRITAIDGRDVEARLAALQRVRSWSREAAARFDFAAEWPASLVLAEAPLRARELHIVREGGDVAIVSVLPETEPPAGEAEAGVEVVAYDGAQVLRVRSFGQPRAERAALFDAAARAIFAADAGLVIDLRGNTGGYGEAAVELISRLAHRELVGGSTRVRLSPRSRAAFRAWRDLPEDPEHPGWSPPEPLRAPPLAPRPAPGPPVVLVDAGCRSACEQAALLLRALGARLLGETTGGASGAPVRVPMPYSGAVLSVPARALFDAEGRPVEGRGVEPDEVVVATLDDLRRGADRALERALELVAGRGAHGEQTLLHTQAATWRVYRTPSEGAMGGLSMRASFGNGNGKGTFGAWSGSGSGSGSGTAP